MSIMDNYKNNICCNKNCVNRTEDKRVFCDDCLEESNKDIKIIPKNYEVTLEGESINVNKSTFSYLIIFSSFQSISPSFTL